MKTIDYKKELESAAKSMILVHEPDVLIKMIIRMVVEKIKVRHASVLLHDKTKDVYILTISQGSLRSKIPVGLARMDKDDPLIYFFRQGKQKLLFNKGVILYEDLEKESEKTNIDSNLRQLLKQVLYQMQILETAACIPSYFQDKLLGILLLGPKFNARKFLSEELDFFIALASNMAMAIRNTQLFKELRLELDKGRQLFIRITIALAAAIEAKDNYTHGHTTRVTNLSLELAERLWQKNKKIFSEKFLENLHIASLLHDVGKIGVPEYILNKHTDLTVGERNKIKEHPTIGVSILKPIKELQEPILGVKYHHERYDGLGYPEGLKEEQIPLIATLISVADSFDAMTTDRPYRPALDKNAAISEIKDLRGLQFNPQVADTFIELYQEGKI